MAPAELHARYERLADFIALSRSFDPQGKLRNKFLNTNIFNET
jgi:alditol oxidase